MKSKAVLLGSLAIVAALVGCRTREDFEVILNSWVGSKESELVSSWGPPTQVYEADGIRFLTYSESGTMVLPGTQPTYQTTVIGNTAYTNAYGGSPPVAVPLSCRITFQVRNGSINTWKWQGNNCY